MKVLFTLGVGMTLGWMSAQLDTQGQIALERHQTEVNTKIKYEASLQKAEKGNLFSKKLFIWP